MDDGLRVLPETDDVSPMHILKATKQLIANRDCLISTGDVDGGVLNAECLALLEFLTARGPSEPKSVLQGNISAAMAGIWRCSEDLCSRKQGTSLAHERLLQFAARLLYLYSTRGYVVLIRPTLPATNFV